MTGIKFISVFIFLKLNLYFRYNFRESVPIIIIPHALHNYLHLSFIYIAWYVVLNIVFVVFTFFSSTCFISQVWYSISMALYYGFYYEFITLNAFMLASSLIAVGTR
jgi:hypothetical protein